MIKTLQMKINLLAVLVFISCTNVHAQSTINTDSLTEKMCSTLKTGIFDSDSAAITNMFVTHLDSYAQTLERSKFDSLYSKCFFRLQITCTLFFKMLEKVNPNKGDWKHVDKIPVSKITQQECNDFFAIKNFTYLEHYGDTTHAALSPNIWIDYFKDDTFSKLTFKKSGDCEFELAFLESNNPSRSGMSNKGDKYIYTLIEKSKGYFLVLVTTPKSEDMALFKLYY
jgi:hypothetical protein